MLAVKKENRLKGARHPSLPWPILQKHHYFVCSYYTENMAISLSPNVFLPLTLLMPLVVFSALYKDTTVKTKRNYLTHTVFPGVGTRMECAALCDIGQRQGKCNSFFVDNEEAGETLLLLVPSCTVHPGQKTPPPTPTKCLFLMSLFPLEGSPPTSQPTTTYQLATTWLLAKLICFMPCVLTLGAVK